MMKTRRENLVKAGVPAEELALIETTSDLDKQTTGSSAIDDLIVSFPWGNTPQKEEYWGQWLSWLEGSTSTKPGPSGCVPEAGQEQEAGAVESWRWLLGRTFNLGMVIGVLDETATVRNGDDEFRILVSELLREHFNHTEQHPDDAAVDRFAP